MCKESKKNPEQEDQIITIEVDKEHPGCRLLSDEEWKELERLDETLVLPDYENM